MTTTAIKDLQSAMQGDARAIIGEVTSVRTMVTATGKRMSWAWLADSSGYVEMLLFPKLDLPPDSLRGMTVRADGKVQVQTSGRRVLLVESIRPVAG